LPRAWSKIINLRLLPAIALLGLGGCQFGATPPPERPPASVPSGSNPNKTNPYVVLGRRYVPLKNSHGYRERGVASWYGPNFHGKPTANGEVFDMNDLSAAHKTLPLPSYAEVTNLRNGRRVVVRINDRGPFVDNRLIDLSRAAAHELDIVGPGTTLVDVRVVPGPDAAGPVAASDTAPASAPSPTSGAAAPDPVFYIQVGAFGDDSNAGRVATTLRDAGFADVSIEPLMRDAYTLHRVRVGPVGSVEQFDQYISTLYSLGYGDARLAID
jgi:rare lipoprotein A